MTPSDFCRTVLCDGEAEGAADLGAGQRREMGRARTVFGLCFASPRKLVILGSMAESTKRRILQGSYLQLYLDPDGPPEVELHCRARSPEAAAHFGKVLEGLGYAHSTVTASPCRKNVAPAPSSQTQPHPVPEEDDPAAPQEPSHAVGQGCSRPKRRDTMKARHPPRPGPVHCGPRLPPGGGRRYQAAQYCSIRRRVLLTLDFFRVTRVHGEITHGKVWFYHPHGEESGHPKFVYPRWPAVTLEAVQQRAQAEHGAEGPGSQPPTPEGQWVRNLALLLSSPEVAAVLGPDPYLLRHATPDSTPEPGAACHAGECPLPGAGAGGEGHTPAPPVVDPATIGGRRMEVVRLGGDPDLQTVLGEALVCVECRTDPHHRACTIGQTLKLRGNPKTQRVQNGMLVPREAGNGAETMSGPVPEGKAPASLTGIAQALQREVPHPGLALLLDNRA